MLHNSFYSVLDKKLNTQEVIYTIKLDGNHDIFKGHFPGNPVTPGVIQMEIVKELATDFTERSLKLQSLSNCKFLAILNPIDSPSIDVNLTFVSDDDLSVKVNAVFKNEIITFLKMSAIYSFN